MPVKLLQLLRILGTTHQTTVARDIPRLEMIQGALPCALQKTDALRKDLPPTEP